MLSYVDRESLLFCFRFSQGPCGGTLVGTLPGSNMHTFPSVEGLLPCPWETGALCCVNISLSAPLVDMLHD